MQHPISAQYEMDPYAQNEPRMHHHPEQLPPRNHFREDAGTQEAEAIMAQLRPLLKTNLERRVAHLMVVDHEPVTIPEFRDQGITKQQLTQAKRRVRQLLTTIHVS